MDFAQGKCKLIISNPNDADSGNYMCKIENTNGCDQITHYVQFTGNYIILYYFKIK